MHIVFHAANTFYFDLFEKKTDKKYIRDCEYFQENLFYTFTVKIHFENPFFYLRISS
ncbi:Uncharacterized protein dnm_082590 [Desulfonema magnum]|uniref:Uncharacterized protein n=1 Tax=Desulfonema magnum TaxID=45655 RepID=A0A975BV40_9BACT|nr:Uncharacterized protein dnm_082590 [Desulfonema magnum]